MNYMYGGKVYRIHRLRLLQQATKNDHAKRKSI